MPEKSYKVSKSTWFYLMVFATWVTLSTSVYASMLSETAEAVELAAHKGKDKGQVAEKADTEEVAEESRATSPYEIRIFNELGDEVFSWFVDPVEGIEDIHLLRYLNKSSFMTESNGVRFYLLRE